MSLKHVFGPVMSGRLGRSLGLDLLGGRVCSMDCVYCEVGKTARLTTACGPYVPAATLLDEVRQWREAELSSGGALPDYVTLGGSGEPCLNTELDEIISGLHEALPGVPVAVLTNATPLTDPEVRKRLALADAVLPSLDSLVEAEFAAVNRPCEGVTAASVAGALQAFRERYDGLLFLEVLLVRGLNDSEENLSRLREFVAGLRPDRVDVTTLSRPGTEADAKAVDAATLARWRETLSAGAEERLSGTETAKPREPQRISDERLAEKVLASLARRPQTVLQLSKALGVEEARVRGVVGTLLQRGDLEERETGEQAFYHARRAE